MCKITLPYLTLPYPYPNLHSSPKSILYCIVFSFFPFPIIRNCCLPCLSVLSMHLAAWLSVLSCLVLSYLSCPSRLSVLSYLSIALLDFQGPGR